MKTTRRNFFKRAGGLIASVAIVQGIVRKLFDAAVAEPVGVGCVFDPTDYIGEVQFVKFNATSPWVNLVTSSKFPEGIGSTTRPVSPEWKEA